jgi:hypothetical protein
VNNGYYFILRQHTLEKMLMFKMSVHGNSSGYDLIKWMQPRGDLQTIWIMFDHVKHVESWRTFACHVYDSFLLQSDNDCDM